MQQYLLWSFVNLESQSRCGLTNLFCNDVQLFLVIVVVNVDRQKNTFCEVFFLIKRVSQ